MFNLANKITLVRIFAVPVIILLLYFPNRISFLLATLVFLAASLTDLLDGAVARRGNMVTNFGKFLDPLADKLLVCSVLIMLVRIGETVPAWVAILIIGRELMVTGLRAVASDQGMVIAADKLGKIKTITQVVALTPLLLHDPWFGFDPVPLGRILLYIALGMTILSGGNYLQSFYRNWLSEESAR